VADDRDIEALGIDGWEAAMRGDIGGSDRSAERLRGSSDPGARAWLMSLAAALWHASPEQGALPDLHRVRALAAASKSARLPAALACAQAERACVLEFDRGSLDAWVALHRELAEEPSDRAACWLTAGVAWLALLGGTPLTVMHGGDPTPTTAGRDASLLVELTALRALAALHTGDVETALRSARRASRMGRTESLPQAEYLAGLVLARSRRLAGHAHLATGILAALARVAPQPWHAWIQWELILAGALPDAQRLAERASNSASSSERAADGLARVVESALAGDRDALDRAVSETSRAVSGCEFARTDLLVLHAALDPFAPDPPDGDVARWRRGETSLVPASVRGLATLSTASVASATVAYVAVLVDRPARRVIASGAPLLEGAVRLYPPKGNPGRVERALAALALAGRKGLATPELFRRVYGFQHAPDVHRGIFDVLLHRARARVRGLAEIEREGDRLRLKGKQPFLVPDPRSVQPLEEFMLRLVARSGGASAKEAAEALNVPLRTVHRALQRLVSEGACQRARAGRTVVYRIEDTTFQEPTRA
jgi:hypothetical protein